MCVRVCVCVCVRLLKYSLFAMLCYFQVYRIVSVTLFQILSPYSLLQNIENDSYAI